MDAVFYTKKPVTRFASDRVVAFGYWNNIGAPIVSSYNFDELLSMIKKVPMAKIEQTFIDELKRNVMFRVAGIPRKASVSIVIYKCRGCKQPLRKNKRSPVRYESCSLHPNNAVGVCLVYIRVRPVAGKDQCADGLGLPRRF